MQKEMRSSKVATFFAWPVSVVLAMVFLFFVADVFTFCGRII